MLRRARAIAARLFAPKREQIRAIERSLNDLEDRYLDLRAEVFRRTMRR